MKIGIHTWGSEGDVRPFLVLADGLAAAGHEVQLEYSAADGRDYSTQLTNARYEHRALSAPCPPEELRRIGREIFAETNQMRQFTRALEELLAPVIDEMTDAAETLATWADVMVLHPMAHPLSAAAEKLRKPFVTLSPIAARATRAFPPPGLPNLGALNSLAWKLVLRTLSLKYAERVNGVRARLGLPSVTRLEKQIDQSAIDLVALSPTLLPRPKDWPQKMHLSGFLTPPQPPERPLDAALEAFLADGPAPVYVTFGSMSTLEQNPHLIAELVGRALETVGCRAIVQSELPVTSSSKVLRVDATPHDRVFPRCAAIVHHGGAGTTQAALRAGRPSVVVAHMGDQFMWGQQLRQLGVAPPHLVRRTLTAQQLTRAIEKATGDVAMRVTAERLGQQMRQEDGVQRAVELIRMQGRR